MSNRRAKEKGMDNFDRIVVSLIAILLLGAILASKVIDEKSLKTLEEANLKLTERVEILEHPK